MLKNFLRDESGLELSEYAVAAALIAIAVVGAFTVLAFDAAFEVFHALFFSAGSYTFDPRTDKLVQLFPMAFWSETATLVGVVILVASAVTWWIARERGRRDRAGRTAAAGGV